MKGNPKIGSYTGTGAAINVETGFTVLFLILFNRTDGDLVGLWTPGVGAGKAIDIAAAAAANAANGITAYTGSVGSASVGFTAGTDYSVSDKVYDYIAFGDE